MKILFLVISIFISQLTLAETYIVEMNKVLNKKERILLEKEINGSIKNFSQYEHEYISRLYIVETSKISALNELSFVRNIERSFEATFMEIKPGASTVNHFNDLFYSKQWALVNQEQQVVKRDVDLEPYVINGRKDIDINWLNIIDKVEADLKKFPVVAVIDMGVEREHPDLIHSIYEYGCDAKGFPHVKKPELNTKKCHGFNFAATKPEHVEIPVDDVSHGTHIAGIIAAKRDNNFGISGVSDKIKILPIKVTGAVDANLRERRKLIIKAPSERIAKGILYAVSAGVDVINLSLGFPKSMDTKYMHFAINEALKNNVTIVAAAGNDAINATLFPCSYRNVICVGSVSVDGTNSAFSNHGGSVDILAPGDEIISTIPQMFVPGNINVENADIMSGTSMATPYVAAVAALLKGVNPNITKEELRYRLYKGASLRPNEEKSLSGLLSLAGAYNSSVDSPLVLPVFKQFDSVVVDSNNGIFKLPIIVENLGTLANLVEIEVSSLSQGVIFSQKLVSHEQIGTGELKTAIVSGLVSDLNVGKNLRYKIKVTVNGESKDFYHEVVMGLNLFSIKKSLNFPVKVSTPNLPIGIYRKDSMTNKIDRSLLIDNLRKISDVGSLSQLPSYYTLFTSKDQSNPGIRLNVFGSYRRTYSEVQGNVFIKNGDRIIRFLRGDFNFDGKLDFLIQTIIREKGKSPYYLFSYRQFNLKPLFKTVSDFKYMVDDTRIDMDESSSKSIRFMKTMLGEESIAVPVFVKTSFDRNSNEGLIPDSDQVIEPFEPKDSSRKPRVYYMSPELTGEVGQFNIHTFNNQPFYKLVKTTMAYSLSSKITVERSNVRLIGNLIQTNDDLAQGVVKSLYAIGEGVHNSYFQVDMSYTMIPKITSRSDIKDNVDFHLLEKQRDLTTNTDSDMLQGFLTKKLFQSVDISGTESQTYVTRIDDKDDILVSFIGSFTNNDERTDILETSDELLFVVNGQEFRKKILKFSFLPGHQMSEVFVPIVLNDSGVMTAAIYNDTRAITKNAVYASYVKEDKLISPLKASVIVPPSCASKDPVLMKDGSHRYMFLCRGKEESYIKIIEL